MKRSVQVVGVLIGLICLVGGLIDLYLQFKEGGAIQWRVPLILIGTGVGLPLIVFPFFEFDSGVDVASMSEEKYIKYTQENLDSPSILGSMSGGYENGDYSGGDYGDPGDD